MPARAARVQLVLQRLGPLVGPGPGLRLAVRVLRSVLAFAALVGVLRLQLRPVLAQLVVTQADVPPDVSVQLIPGGNQVVGEATLDLCSGNFPSESKRTARLQADLFSAISIKPLTSNIEK